MSSFVGHTLTGGFIYSLKADTSKYRYLWLIWLLIVSILPDREYFIPSLQEPQHGGIRITHSLSFGILFPILTIIALFLLQCRGKEIKVPSIKVLLAGISHIFLDFLVGVHPMPLF